MKKLAKVYADGGSINNKGVAACVLIYDDGTIDAHVRYLPSATNNVAEYTGLILALEHIKNHEWDGELPIYLDSQLVINQVRGTWKITKKHLKPLAREAKEKIAEVQEQNPAIRLHWVPSEENAAHKFTNILLFEPAKEVI